MLSLFLLDVLACHRVSEIISKAKINQVYLLILVNKLIAILLTLIFADQLSLLGYALEHKVFGFHISVNDTFVVDLFKSRQLLAKLS